MEQLPDAYVAIEKPKDNFDRYFLDIIDDNMPRFAIRYKVRRYFEYFDSNLWQDGRDDPFPSVRIICPHLSLKKYLHKFIIRTLEEEFAEINFYLALEEQISLENSKTDIWEQVVIDDY